MVDGETTSLLQEGKVPILGKAIKVGGNLMLIGPIT
jgi:hypothetical protein